MQHHPGSCQLGRAHEYIMGGTCACGPTVVRCCNRYFCTPRQASLQGGHMIRRNMLRYHDASTRSITPHPPRLLRFTAKSGMGIPWLYLPSTYSTDLLQHKSDAPLSSTCKILPSLRQRQRYSIIHSVHLIQPPFPSLYHPILLPPTMPVAAVTTSAGKIFTSSLYERRADTT